MKKTLWMASLIAPASVFLMPVRAGAERNNINPPTIWTWVFPLCTVEDEAGNQIEQLEFGKKATFVAESKYALSSSVEWTYRANASSPASQKIWEKRWVSGVVCTADVEIVTAAMAAERGWTDLGVRASALAVNFDGAAAFIVDPPIPVGCCACAKGQCDQPGGTKSTHVSGLQAQMSFGHGGALGLMPNAEFTDVNRAMAIEGLAAICNKIAQKTPEQFPSPEGVAAMEPLPDSRAGQTLRFVPLSEAGLPDANGIYDLSGAVSSNWISMERIGQPLDEDSTAPYAYEIRRASGNLVEREVCVPVPPVSPDPALSAPLRKGAWNVWTYKEEGETSTLLQRTVNTRSLTDTTLTESYTVLDGEGATLHVSELRTTYLPGFQTIQTVTRVRDPGPAGRNETTTTQYYTNPAETNRYGKEYRTVRPDGSWTEYDYDNQGRVSVRQQGLLDAEAGGASSATTYGYTAVDVADDGTFPDRPRTVVRSIDGVEVSRTYTSALTTPA
ncbi:MAG: hypothetical protein KJ579_02940 [Verrucomicrobia bacterium]|nr:hypothetical protein [Verrucomicrobiota bacterium]